MPDVSQIISKIKKLVVGSAIEDLEKVSKSLKRLSPVSTTVDIATFSDLLHAVASKKGSGIDLGVLEKEFNLTGIQVEQDRIARYNEYNDIVKKIPYMKRALKVMVQNILSPDDFTKIAIQIDLSDQTVDDIKSDMLKEKVEKILKIYELEDRIFDIVYNTLKLGDYFIEIVIVDELLKKYKLIDSDQKQEGQMLQEDSMLSPTFIKGEVIAETITPETGQQQRKPSEIRFVIEETVPDDVYEKVIKGKDKLSYDQFFLNFLNPACVVRLGDKFNYGYLVFNVSVDKLKNVAGSIDMSSQQVVNATNKILQTISKDPKFFEEHEDLKYVVAKILSTYTGNYVRVRYVRPELMEHFTVQTTEFPPYGTSIFYGSEFLSKVVVAQQASIMIHRLTNAVEKRIINVELGSSRDARKYLEELKRTMMRRRISIDELGTVSDIPSNITTFEDIYVPMKDGKSFVTFDTLPPRGDIGARVEDLKAMRDSLVASVEVPPAYIGLEENVESRALLAQENVIFAATIILYQKQIAKHLTSLVHKILDITSNDPNDRKILITFAPPKSIIVERLNEYYGNVSNIITTLVQLGIPKDMLFDKFLSDFDMSEIKKYQTEDKLSKVFSKQEEEESEEGGLGGLGGLGGFGGGFETGGGGETGGVF